MKPLDFAFVLSFPFVLGGALSASGCAAQAAAPAANGPQPPELQIGGDDDEQGEADPPPPPSAPPPTQAPAAPGAPPPPPTETGQMAPPSQPAAAPASPAPSAPPPGPAPVAQGPAPAQPVDAPPAASGQWIYTSQYGWLWMPYSHDYTYVSPDGGVAYEYAYYPNSGWRWVYSPWVLGWGPSPYWGRVGPHPYVWYSHPWFRVGVVHRGPVYHRRWHRR